MALADKLHALCAKGSGEEVDEFLVSLLNQNRDDEKEVTENLKEDAQLMVAQLVNARDESRHTALHISILHR